MDKGEFVPLCDWKGAFGARAATFDYIKDMSLCVADGGDVLEWRKHAE